MKYLFSLLILFFPAAAWAECPHTLQDMNNLVARVLKIDPAPALPTFVKVPAASWVFAAPAVYAPRQDRVYVKERPLIPANEIVHELAHSALHKFLREHDTSVKAQEIVATYVEYKYMQACMAGH